MDEKTIQRIKKLQALAERGVGGEKTTAQKKLAKLLKDNGINSLDDEDALEGLDIVTEQIEDAKAFNPALKLAGVLITSYQNTDGEAAGVEWLEQKTDFNILGIIRYSKKVAENTFMRKPIYEYSPCCGAAQGYKKFVTAYTGKAR